MEQEVLKICFRLIELGVPPEMVKPIHNMALGVTQDVPTMFIPPRHTVGQVQDWILTLLAEKESGVYLAQSEIRGLLKMQGYEVSASTMSLNVNRLCQEGKLRKDPFGRFAKV